ncbi:MAG: hypothetical protein SF029_01650 [bacterium]|nr:hypothetical protein [bacterium]
MGYDCYATLQAHIPDAAVGHSILDLLEADEDWGVFPVSEVGDDYLYCQWEGRNRDEDEVSVMLEPIALRFSITFEVEYSSDYDAGLRFFVGVDGEGLNAVNLLERTTEVVRDLLSQSPAILGSLLEDPQQHAAFEGLIHNLQTLLKESRGKEA